MKKNKISIVDIAKLANVSTATVSRVINKHGGYSKATEERVLNIIDEYSFKPNSNAIGLRTNRSNSIGVIVPDITNEFFASIVHELDMFFLQHRYSVLICDSNEDPVLEDLHINDLIQKNVDGIIYISGQAEIKPFEHSSGIPIVYVDRCPNNAEILIHSDNKQGGYLAAKELIEKGCLDILLVRDIRYASTIRHRKEGFLKALSESNINHTNEFELSIYPTYSKARTTMATLLKEKGCFFDGIFTTNDAMALACIHSLHDAGYKVPKDVKVVGFDNISITEFCNPSITTIKQNFKKLAYYSGKAILDLINNKKISVKDISVPVTIIKRDST